MSRRRDVRATVVLALVMLAGLLCAPIWRADAMVPEDVLTMRTVAVDDLSPDGRFLLYTVQAWDAASGTRTGRTLKRDLETGRELVLFTPGERAHGAVWRPDGGVIAYLRRGEGGDELWLMNADGGERRRAGPQAGPFGALHWAPTGDAIAWVADAAVGEYDGKPDVRIVADHLGYRHLGDGYRQGRLGQLFVMDLANGVPRRVVQAALDVRGVDWSPDGRRLVFEAKAEADLGRNVNTDLWLVAREGGPLRRLTANPGADGSPRWYAPDAIAYLRAEDPLWETAPNVVAVIDPGTGEATSPGDGDAQVHGGGLDDRFWRFAVADGRFVVLLARRGSMALVQVAGDTHRTLAGRGFDYWSLHVGGGRAVMAGSGQVLPSGIFTANLNADPAAGTTVPPPGLLIDPNADWRDRVELADPEPFRATVDGHTIEGWFFKPLDLEPGQRVPLVLSLHGGPEWMYGGDFLPEFHILPRFGYGVVIANPVGSLGYGLDFQRDIRGDWVERPAREVMACVDLAVAEGWADPDRLAVMGGSYGGHLGAALTTQSDRFRAAALDRMYPEPVSFWGTTDEKWFPEWEFKGRPWDPGAAAVYARNSPFARVARVTTPTLISHGGRDYRCLSAGAEMWFSALQSRGVPSRFIRFETEGHGIENPANQVFYYHQLLSWFDRYVLDADDGADEDHE